MISVGSEAAAADAAEQLTRSLPCGRGLELRGAGDSWRSAAAKSTCELLHLRPVKCNLQARNQEPGTESWLLASLHNDIEALSPSTTRPLCACDG